MSDRINDFMRAWWPVAVALAALCAAWGSSYVRIVAIASSQDRMMVKQDLVAADIRKVAESLAALQARTEFNTESIGDLRARVHELESRR